MSTIEYVKDGQVVETTASENKTYNEKSTVEVTGNEPYDAAVNNINYGEFPMHPPPPHGEFDTLKEELDAEEPLDLYKPFPIDPEIAYEPHILTFRAVVTGMVLGCLVNASNLYLGLKTGFTFGAS